MSLLYCLGIPEGKESRPCSDAAFSLNWVGTAKEGFASLFNCMPFGRTWDSKTDPT